MCGRTYTVHTNLKDVQLISSECLYMYLFCSIHVYLYVHVCSLYLFSTQRQQVRSLQTEIDNYKKSVTKEQETNEELTMMLNKVEADINHVKKLIELSAAKREELKIEYMTYTRTLQETEQSLAKATTVRTFDIHVQYMYNIV